jgi:hypothetical protein
MDSAKLNDWIQAIGIIAVVASLVFVGLQLRQDRAFAVSEAIVGRSDTISDLADMISDNKELWVSALNGDELSEPELATFQAMVELVESYFFGLWIRTSGASGVVVSVGRQRGAAIDTYAFALYSHKGLRQNWEAQLNYWRARDAAFDDDEPGTAFRRLVAEKLVHLDETAARLPDEKRYAFW